MKSFLRSLAHIITLLIAFFAVCGLVLLFFSPSTLTSLIDYLKGIVVSLGWKNYLFAGLVCILESIPFINMIFPGAILIVIIGGFLAQTHYRDITLLVIIFTIIGDSIAYILGYTKGHTLLSSYGNIIGLTPDRLEKLKATIKKHDYLAIFASKWTNYTRGIVPFLSGLSHTKWTKFLFWNIVGSIVYGSIIILLAKIFLGNYDRVLPYLRIIAAIILIGTGLWYLISYYANNNKGR